MSQTSTPAGSDYERARACYAAAYRALPLNAFADSAWVVGRFAEDPDRAAKVVYLLACQTVGLTPPDEDMRAVSAHPYPISARYTAYVMTFPHFEAPPARSDAEPDDGLPDIILAPYFAAIVTTDESVERCFVLGQSPSGGTTFREVTKSTNANLGPGCDPDIDAFVDLVADQVTGEAGAREPVAAISWDDPPKPAKRWWEFWK